MSKLLLLLLATCSVLLSATAISSASPEPTTTEAAVSLWLENNIPKIADGCTAHYVCKKKIKYGSGRVCVKYCLKKVACPANVNGVPATISPDWCVLLNQDALEEVETSTGGYVTTMQVNMIDFPCQPGYLPDSRGRCREVW